MSAEEELELDISEMCFRCTIHNRNKQSVRYIPSSEFRFQGGGWKLCYYYHPEDGGEHNLLLQRWSGVPPDPFHVSVQVESSGTGRILSAPSQVTRFTNEFEEAWGCRSIWSKREDEILEAVPEFRLYGVQKLVVVLKLGGDSTGTLCHSAPAVQTTSSVPCLESLSEDFSRLLEQGSNPDVEFQCAGQSTKAHAAVVSARSQVIASMLSSDMIEGKTRVVKVPDMEPDIFKKFLRYLYTGRLDELTFEVALRLFEAGDQYAVAGLAKRCSEYLMEHLSVQNACEVLVIADAHSNKDFIEKVVEYMVCERVPLTSEVWPAFCDEHPRLANKVLNRGWAVLVK